MRSGTTVRRSLAPGRHRRFLLSRAAVEYPPELLAEGLAQQRRDGVSNLLVLAAEAPAELDALREALCSSALVE
jgi:hypothetical protein